MAADTKLTADERAYLRRSMSHPSVLKALRIIDALTAENERLRAELEELDARLQDADADVCSDQYQCWKAEKAAQVAAEARLATAEGLIQEVWDNGDIPRKIGLKLQRFLASAQPAATDPSDACRYDTSTVAQPAAPVRAEASMQAQSTGEFALAMAEKAVLDAMARAKIWRYSNGTLTYRRDDVELACEAELARREAAK